MKCTMGREGSREPRADLKCVIAVVGLGVDAVAGGVRKILFAAVPEGANRSEGREEAQCYRALGRVYPAESSMQAKPSSRVAVVIAVAIRYCNEEAKGCNRPICSKEAEMTPR